RIGCPLFFQAADGIRDFHVTGVQTCALPISDDVERRLLATRGDGPVSGGVPAPAAAVGADEVVHEHVVLDGRSEGQGRRERLGRSEERRVGNESRAPCAPYAWKVMGWCEDRR